ncbi:MAG: D-tyrosyl-tRNA(Tyr) deacylase [Candidatus Cloacimonetes bacterium]|nr:D-tyrosyl-tRNA(Tyr) deacylase [Candidatus Cloacimonadota bacterium]
MRAVLQRVDRGSVSIDGTIHGQIGKGLVILVGFGHGDNAETVRKMCRKILQLRIFEDENGKMNRSVTDINGELLIISQFTLFADCRRGNRPDFIQAMPPQAAESIYDQFVRSMQGCGLYVQTGKFAAYMQLSLVNNGPVTIIIDLSE